MADAAESEKGALEQSPQPAAAIENRRSASDEVKVSPATEVAVVDGELTEDAALGPASSGTPICTVETEPVDVHAQEVIDLTMSDDDEDQEAVVTVTKLRAPLVKKEPGEDNNHDITQSNRLQGSQDHATSTGIESTVPHQGTDEVMNQEEMLQIAMFNFNNASSQDGCDGEGGARTEHHQGTSDLPEFDSEGEDTRLTMEFHNIKKSYQTKKRNNQLTDEDEIDYSRACHAEEERKQLRSNRFAYQFRDAQEQSMFFPEEEPTPSPPTVDISDDPGDEITPAARSKRQLSTRLPGQ